jgi:hypothetical protein
MSSVCERGLVKPRKYVLGLLLGAAVKQPRRSRDWRELQAQLGLAGFAMETRTLLLDACGNSEVQYGVPSNVGLSVEHGVRWLVWGDGLPDAPPCTSPADRACLSGFIRLGGGPDRGILEYAKCWGPLGDACRRAVPADFPHLVSHAAAPRICEPIEAWRRLARQLQATLQLAARLQRGEVAPLLGSGAHAWEMIAAADPMNARYSAWIDELSAGRSVVAATEDPTTAELLNLERAAIARVVDLWLTLGGVQLVPYWDAARSRMLIRVDFHRAPGLAGRLALEVASVLTSPFGVVQCDGCGYPYAPVKRRPRSDRRAYCPACSEGTSVAAKRDWWRRNRSATSPSDRLASGSDTGR